MSNKNIHTVIVLAYNHEKYISAALDSILTGKKVPDQVIVVDDCSTDLTLEILKKYKKKYPGILELVENKSNLGIFDNLNQIYEAPVRGDLVSFLGGDDIYDLSLLAAMDSELEKYDLDPKKDKFMMLPNIANLFLDGSTDLLDNSAIDRIRNATPFQIALRSKLYSMHVGISVALYREWARFPKNAMRDIGIYADLPHYLCNIKACDFFVPVRSSTSYHRVGVGVTSRSQKLSPQESRYRAMRVVLDKFKNDLSLSDWFYVNFTMAIDSIYTHRSFLENAKIIWLFPLALITENIERDYYVKSMRKLVEDAIGRLKKSLNVFKG